MEHPRQHPLSTTQRRRSTATERAPSWRAGLVSIAAGILLACGGDATPSLDAGPADGSLTDGMVMFDGGPDLDGGPMDADVPADGGDPDGGPFDATTPACTSNAECDDGNLCTADRCEPATGCVHDGTGVTSACDDGDLCTVGDACAADAAGSCAGTPDTCDDGNACTADSCDGVTGCGHAPIRTHACSPTIVVTSPSRGAALSAPSGATTVTVTGEVTSGAGPITTFTVNGTAVPLDVSGSFGTDVPVHEGANVLVLEAVDALGTSRRRVQAFLWSSHYRDPSDPATMAGAVDGSVALWLGPTAIDDGDATSPVDDLAATIAPLGSRVDLSAVYSPSVSIASAAGYNVYMTSLTSVATTARLTPVAGGLDLDLAIEGLSGDLFFDCAVAGCQLGGGDSTGGFSADAIAVHARLTVEVLPDRTLVVTADSPATTIDNLVVESDTGWTNFLVGILYPTVQASVEAIGAQLASLVTPMTAVLEAALRSPARTVMHSRAALDSSTIAFEVRSDFTSATPTTAGLGMALRTGAYSTATVSYSSLGVPSLLGCGSGAFVPPALASTDEVEQAAHLDAANQQPFAQWRAGLLEATLPAGFVDLGAYPVTQPVIRMSGMLAPTLDDCDAGGTLRSVIGDLRVELELVYSGTPITAVAYASIVSDVSAESDASELAFRISGAPSIALEVTATDAAGIVYDAELAPIATDVVRAVLSALAAEPLVRLALPEFDGGGVEPEVPPRTGLELSPATTAQIPNAARVAGPASEIR